MPTVDVQRLPAHIAIIMDGNGRWAQLAGRPRTAGHRRGSDAVRRIVQACRRMGVPALTLYAFSEQNWARPRLEVEALMLLLRDFLQREHDDILAKRIRLRAVGRLGRLPASVREVLDPLVQRSARHDGMVLTLALSYGGREEIVDAARALASRARDLQLDPQGIDEAMLEREMASLDVGPVDLLIRTGGEQRISNFLLWGAAYAELFFSPTLWPDYSEADLVQAIAAYQARQRRFGRLASDVASPVVTAPAATAAASAAAPVAALRA